MEKKDLLANYAASKQNMCITNDTISDRLFQEYGVNRGLRDVNGKGVLTGLPRISKIVLRRLLICCCLENFRIRRSWMNSVRCSATAGHFRPILPETLL